MTRVSTRWPTGIHRLRKALWDALEADEAKQVENDEKGVRCCRHPGGPRGSDVG
jgi:hypothetical protein